MRPTRTNDNAWVNRLNLAVPVREFDQNIVRIRLHFRRRDPTLDRTAQRCEMGLENPLGLVLRQAAMELTPAIDTLESRGTKLGHTRAVYPVSPDMLGRLQERRQQADRVQDLKCARLDRRGASLAVRLNLPLDKPYAHSVTGQFAGSEQSGRACPIIKTSFRVIRLPRKDSLLGVPSLRAQSILVELAKRCPQFPQLVLGSSIRRTLCD